MVFIVSIWWLLVMNKIENDEIVLVLYIDKVLVDRWLNATEYVEHKPVSYLFFFHTKNFNISEGNITTIDGSLQS